MNNRVVVVADALRARMFIVEKDDALQAGSRLVEKMDLVNTDYRARGRDAPGVRTERNTSRQAGPMHPQDAERDWHRAEVERRFAREIAAHVLTMTGSVKSRGLVLAAEPRMLGLIRRPLHAAAGKPVLIREIAGNYTRFTPARLHRRLMQDRML
jgi:protein required for attachment to host cells